MAQFPALELTAKGQDMIIRASSGKEEDRLVITRAKLGDGILNKDIRTLEDIISTKLVVPLSQIKVINKQAQATFVYDNKNLTEGFYHREVGVFAKNGSNGAEFLLSYSNAGSYTSYIPSQKTPIPSQTMNIVIGVSNSDNVELHIVDEGVVTPKQLEELKAFIEGLINSHKNKKEIDHPDKSIEQRHLANDCVGHMQLEADSVYGSAIKNESITPDKLSKEYLPMKDGKVVDTTTFTGIVNFNNNVTLTTSKIIDNSNSAISSAWAKSNLVSSVEGLKGNISIKGIYNRYGGRFNSTGIKASEIAKKGYFDSYHSETQEAFLPSNKRYMYVRYTPLDTDLFSVIYSKNNGGEIYFTYKNSDEYITSESWQRVLTDNNINDCITIYKYNMKGKSTNELSNLGFVKLYCSDKASELGYPINYAIVLNFPAASSKNSGIVHQIAIGPENSLFIRYLDGNNQPDKTPWTKYASSDYVDKAIKEATKVEILDFE